MYGTVPPVWMDLYDGVCVCVSLFDESLMWLKETTINLSLK